MFEIESIPGGAAVAKGIVLANFTGFRTIKPVSSCTAAMNIYKIVLHVEETGQRRHAPDQVKYYRSTRCVALPGQSDPGMNATRIEEKTDGNY
jgi:hypothetical protein